MKIGAGVLHLVINTDNSGTIALYDSPTTTTNPICNIDASNVTGSFTFDLPFSNGLWLVTGAGVDCTIVYE